MWLTSALSILGICILMGLEGAHAKKASEGSEISLVSKSDSKGAAFFSAKQRKPRKTGLKFCGSQGIPPLKDLVCKDYCEEGECRDFYCECQSEVALKQSCVRAEEYSRCAGICKKANFSNSFQCPKRQLQQPCTTRHCKVETTEYHCFCS